MRNKNRLTPRIQMSGTCWYPRWEAGELAEKEGESLQKILVGRSEDASGDFVFFFFGSPGAGGSQVDFIPLLFYLYYYDGSTRRCFSFSLPFHLSFPPALPPLHERENAKVHSGRKCHYFSCTLGYSGQVGRRNGFWCSNLLFYAIFFFLFLLPWKEH